jgi:hypothetical protein
MPRYAFPQPSPPKCRAEEGCDRTALSWTNPICRMHYQREWRERNLHRMAVYRDQYDQRVGRRYYAPKD